MKRILHVIPTLEGGGAERQLAMLAAEQVAGGLDVHIGLRRRGVHADRAERGGARIHLLGDRRGLDPRLWLEIRRLISATAPDVVQTWLPQADVFGGLAAKMAGKAWVMSERASASSYSWRAPADVLRIALAPWADAVVSNSRIGADYWRRKRIRPDRLSLVPNAVDLAAIRSAAQPDGRQPRDLLLSVGRLVPSKGHQTVLDAVGLLDSPSPRLLILGEGPQAGSLRAYIDEHRIPADIAPFRLDWWPLFARTRALISLSEHEGAPNVVLEAMAAGVPLVLSDIPAHRDILDEQCAWWVPCRDAQAAAAALQECLDSPVEAARRVGLAAERVAAMSISRTAARYRAVYATITGESALPCAE